MRYKRNNNEYESRTTQVELEQYEFIELQMRKNKYQDPFTVTYTVVPWEKTSRSAIYHHSTLKRKTI